MKLLFRVLRLSRLALRNTMKFLRRDLVFAGALVLLVVLTTLAAIGYLLVPDRTTNAPQYSKAIGRQPPGFEVMMLRVVDNIAAPQQSFYSKFFHGTKTNETYIPISSSHYDGTDIIVKEYSAAGDSLFESRFNLADVVYAINPEKKIFERNSGIFFETIDGRSSGESISDLQAIIDGQYLVKKKFLLGTDRFGRDVFSRFIRSMRVTLFAALTVTLMSLMVGMAWGFLCCTMPVSMAKVFYWIAESIQSVPGILLAAIVVFTIGNGFLHLCLAIGLVFSAQVARMVLDHVFEFRKKQFAMAGISLGLLRRQMWWKQLMPFIGRPLIAYGATLFCGSVLIESGLNFLGLGMNADTPTWGYMIRENFGYIIVPGYSYMTLLPGISIVVVSLAFVLLSRRIQFHLAQRDQRILV